MKNIFTLTIALVFALNSGAQITKHDRKAMHTSVINQLLSQNRQPVAAMKTTAGVLTQRVVAQSKRDNGLGSMADSVRLSYTGMRGSTYDYNNMMYPYNYCYSTTPMFNYAGVFTTPQVLADTYVHWTINPFTMPAFNIYEFSFATYDTANNLTNFRELFVDSVTNDNRSYVNTFNAAKKIATGFWFNLNAGIADSAFKQFFAYNTAGKLSADSVYELHLGVWRKAAKTNYTYDGAGNLTQIDHWANETDTSFLLPLVQQSKYVNTYDASNRLVTVLTSQFNGTTLAAYVKDTFGYSGTLTYHNSWKQHQLDAIHGTWWPQYYMAKTIVAGKPDTIYHRGWDSIANSWVPISRDIVGYNSYNNPDTMFNYEWNWTSYSTTPDYTTVYYYDTFTLVTPSTGVQIAQTKSMTLYPNPATNSLTIRIPEMATGSAVTVCVMNQMGQLMSRQQMPYREDSQIPVDYLAPGMYWMVVQQAATGELYKQQFIKH